MRYQKSLLKRLPQYRDVQSREGFDDLGQVKSLRGATVLVLGTGDIGSSFAALCKALGAARTIGLRRDPAKEAQGIDEMHPLSALDTLLPLADVFLLPSEFESFGLAALVAMACGTPAVAFASGGLPEVVTDGVDGRLVPPLDDAALAEAVLDLLETPERLAAFGAAARASAVERFTPDRVVPQYEAVYRRVVEAGGPVA